jgi:hypothetical protein
VAQGHSKAVARPQQEQLTRVVAAVAVVQQTAVQAVAVLS